MQIRANQLDSRLEAGPLAAVYLVMGDEPLLVEEACAAIVAAAEREGYGDRKRFDLTVDGSLEEALAGAANMSLFASRRLLDVRIPPRGLDRRGSDTLRKFLDRMPAGTLLLCRAPGLEWRARSSAWVRALDKAGIVVQVWPVSGRELPRWLEARCRASGVELDRDALAILADRVEGNLLAACQEIEALRLAGHEGVVGADELLAAVSDSSRFDTFEMIDAALAGRGARASRMVRVLRRDGVPIFMVLGALVNQLRRAREVSEGGRPRLPRNRARVVSDAAGRLGAAGIDAALGDAALVDLQAKGMLRGDAWQSLETVVLGVAGHSGDGVRGLGATEAWRRHR